MLELLADSWDVATVSGVCQKYGTHSFIAPRCAEPQRANRLRLYIRAIETLYPFKVDPGALYPILLRLSKDFQIVEHVGVCNLQTNNSRDQVSCNRNEIKDRHRDLETSAAIMMVFKTRRFFRGLNLWLR